VTLVALSLGASLVCAAAPEAEGAQPLDAADAGDSAEPPVEGPTPPSMADTPTDGGGPADTHEVGVVEVREKDPTIFPDPKKFSTGFFVEGSTGPLVPIGPTRDVLSPGFSLTARVGYEIRRWVALQVHATGSISSYDDDVLQGELLQQYFYIGELRFGVPIRRVLIALQGGAGAYQLSNNLLQVADIAEDNGLFGLAWDASLAVDIHSLNKHFSGGVVATYIGMPALQNAGAMSVQIYIRYAL
jgi:hypothetical protein